MTRFALAGSSRHFAARTWGARILFALSVALGGSVSAAPAAPSLKDAYHDDFLIGVALNERQFTAPSPAEAAVILGQFNAISPENALKWGAIHPQPDRYNFGPADRYVAFGEKHGMFIVGHTLVWHHQTPRWVFEDHGQPVSREVLLQRMHDHIFAVVGRYKGRVKGWDVVNEALAEDGTLRPSPWRNIIGDDFIVKAFEFAHEADPAAELYYNEYGLENAPKRRGAIALIRRLRAAGVRVDGVGLQEHVNLRWPTAEALDATLRDFAAAGIRTMITELDVDVLPEHHFTSGNADVSRRTVADPALNPYKDGLPPDMQQKLADRYAQLFAIYLRYRANIERVTFWGVTDRSSWLNNWPVRGRTSYPLPFDRNARPKPCYDAILTAAQSAGHPDTASSPTPSGPASHQ